MTKVYVKIGNKHITGYSTAIEMEHVPRIGEWVYVNDVLHEVHVVCTHLMKPDNYTDDNWVASVTVILKSS